MRCRSPTGSNRAPEGGSRQYRGVLHPIRGVKLDFGLMGLDARGAKGPALAGPLVGMPLPSVVVVLNGGMPGGGGARQGVLKGQR